MNFGVAIVTRALAPYHKALQEPFADAVGAGGGRVRIFYPQGTASAFNYVSTVPRSHSLTVEHVLSARISPAIMSFGLRWKSEANETRLPSMQLWQALTRFNPALVWIHEYSPYSLTGLLWAKMHGRPVVVSTDIGRDNQHIFVKRACVWHRFWGRFTDGVIACTQGALKPLAPQPKPVVAAFHAADSRHLTPQSVRGDDEVLHFVQTARVQPIKGVDLLLAAFARLRDEGLTKWKLRLVGADQAGWGQAQIDRFGLQERVEITGHLDGSQLQDAFGKADVFVLATRSDTYAAVVHEAACLGLPLIISKHAGAAEVLVKEGINGHIIDPEDVVQFASRLRGLFDPQLRQSMSRASRVTGEEFSAHQRALALWAWMQNHFIRRGGEMCQA